MLTRITLKGPLGLSLIAMAIGAVALLAQVPALLSAAFSRGVGENRTLAALDEHVKRHDGLASLASRRFQSRYLFYPPESPRQSATTADLPEPVDRDETSEQLVIPAQRRHYSGPSVAYVVGDRVYFRVGDAMRELRVGEERHGLRIVAVNAPWSVRIAIGDDQFDVVPIEWMQREHHYFHAPAVPEAGSWISLNRGETS